jgi:hypothetical protein
MPMTDYVSLDLVTKQKHFSFMKFSDKAQAALSSLALLFCFD